MAHSAPRPTDAFAWAVTMFSFTNELHERTRSADALLREVAAQHIAGAVEVDAAQHFRTFPAISVEEVAAFRRTMDDTGMTPTMMGGYVDIRLDQRGPRDADEQLEFLRQQVAAAGAMGFFGVRVGLGAVPPELSERLLPDLERHGVSLLSEVQAGAQPDAPAIDRAREQRARLHTDRLGFVFDSSLVMPILPTTWKRALRDDRVPEHVITLAERLWRDRDAHGWPVIAETITPLGLPSAAVRRLEMPFRRFGHTTVADWDDLLDEVTSVHLKYWDLEDTDGALSRQAAEIKAALRAHGYTGYVCSEWGGHDWLEPDIASAFAMTRGHRELFDAA